MRYVNLTTVDDTYQAHFLKKALEDEGIRCIVVNEHTSPALSLAGPIGAMIQIRVAEVDYNAAAKVLQDLKAETDKIVCPNCGSSDLKYGFGTKNKFLKVAWVILLSIFAPVATKYHFVYSCNNCGTEFRKNKY